MQACFTTAPRRRSFTHLALLVAFAAAALLAGVLLGPGRAQAQAIGKVDIPGPPGSGEFGREIVALPNGNFVVIDPFYDDGATPDVGAVHLYDGVTLQRISTLKGSAPGDMGAFNMGYGTWVTVLDDGNFAVFSNAWSTYRGAVTWGDAATGFGAPVATISTVNSLVGGTPSDYVGSDVVPLPNGAYVVASPDWDNAGAAHAGAATWAAPGGGTVGLVSAANSLVGTQANDRVGDWVVGLSNGNYVVLSPDWDNGGVANLGAATWGDGDGGTLGTISAANSLVGSKADDLVGYDVAVLTNGNYVVMSQYWDNGGAADAGAATWGNGDGGTVGPVTAANSLVGSTAGDKVGGFGVEPLTDGDYVVLSIYWDNGGAADAGAATWGNGNGGTVGPVSPANSLVGSTANDRIGNRCVGLANGAYVVGSPVWDNGGTVNAGVAAWADGNGGTVGLLSAGNSLVGTSTNDNVSNLIRPLANGNYVVATYLWDNGAVADAGAATWGNGAGGTFGPVSAANSLVGSTAGDYVGSEVTVLPNGHYVVHSRLWDNGGIADAGALTWANGAGGTVGPVSAANSLFGSSTNDRVGEYALDVLADGDYVVSNSGWDNLGLLDAGAATWANGNGGTVGPVSAANSLVGSKAGDEVGYNGVTELANGNYVVRSKFWDNGAAANVGAITWANGAGGTVGPVSPANSLVGSTMSDELPDYTVRALSDGDYLALAIRWDNGGLTDVGAAALGDGTAPSAGPLSAANSVIGGVPNAGLRLVVEENDAHAYALVGRPAENVVTAAARRWRLSVGKAGNGGGTVTSVPAAIACGVTCTASLAPNTAVALAATPAAGSTFTGWSGACSGTGLCMLTMDKLQAATATFTLTEHDVVVNPATQGGQVTVKVVTTTLEAGAAGLPVAVGPAGAENVAALYPFGTVLELTAIPHAGFAFTGWGGGLSGKQNPAQVTVIGPLNITAGFAAKPVYLPLIDR